MTSKSTAIRLDVYELLRSKGATTRAAGIAQQYLIQVAKGRRAAGPNAIRKMAKALDVSTEVIFSACQESWGRAHAGKRTPKIPAAQIIPSPNAALPGAA